MALNFTVSYTFSPSTTISSSQVNTNTSDVANVFNGLEAETKTLAKLKMDADPTLALEVATKQYVDHYSTWRRPVLQYSSTTVVNIETGINGTSGQAQILFPDGNLRTDSTSSRINCNLAQVAALSGTAQSGLQTGTVSNNTWYWIYAVKVSDSSTTFVTVADKTNGPFQASFSTLNTNFGSNSWVYLGLIRYGDNSGTANAILNFKMAGNTTQFLNLCTGTALGSFGIRLATTAAATTLVYTYVSGTGAAQIPANVFLSFWQGCKNIDSGGANRGAYWIDTFAGVWFGMQMDISTIAFNGISALGLAVNGITGINPHANNCQWDIYIKGFTDSILGIGSNPLL